MKPDSFRRAFMGRIVKAMGGWTAICSWNANELSFRKNEFVKLYLGMLSELQQAGRSGM